MRGSGIVLQRLAASWRAAGGRALEKEIENKGGLCEGEGGSARGEEAAL